MPPRQIDIFRFTRGFVPTQPRLGGYPDSLIDGRNVLVLANGRLRSARGLLAGGASGSPRPAMNVGSSFGGLTGNGTILLFANTRFVAGSGTATVGGASIGAVSGQLMVEVGGLLVAAGLTAPGAPVIADSGVAGRNNGSYSIALTAIRSSTGAESSMGIPSNPISLKNKKVRITSFPAVPTGADRWGIYCTFTGFANTGPWRHLTDIPTSTVAPFDLDWLNGQLGRLAPLDYDPPPPCTHCFSIDNVLVAAGAYGGYGLSPSVPGRPEAFPPDQVVFLSRGEPIVACKGSGFAGRVFVACANSFHEVVRSGSTVTPIIARPIWPNTGFVGHSAWCVVEDTVYGMSGQMGAVRTRGDEVPDTTFALDVQEFFADDGFTSANTVVGYDPSIDAVVFMSGTLALPFQRSREVWSTPIEMPGTAATAVTVNGELLVDIGGTMHTFERGAGGNFYIVPAFHDGDAPELMKTIVGMRAASDVDLQLDLLTDLDTVTSRASKASAAGHGDWHKLNVRLVESYTVKASSTGAGKSVHEILVEHIPHPVRAA